jgi:hypothetical protein
MMDEMQKTLARRRAKVDKAEEVCYFNFLIWNYSFKDFGTFPSATVSWF